MDPIRAGARAVPGLVEEEVLVGSVCVVLVAELETQLGGLGLKPWDQLEAPAQPKGLPRATAVTIAPVRGRASAGKGDRREVKSPEQGSNAGRSEREEDDDGAGGPEKTLRGARSFPAIAD